MTTAAGRARALQAPARSSRATRSARRPHLARWVLHGVWRMAVLGVAVGAGLVWLDPLVAAVVGLATAAVGVLLSEGRLHGADRAVLVAAAGIMAPALAYLIAQLVHLL